MAKRIAAIGLYFAFISFAMTASTALAVWEGNGGHPPLTVVDAYIFVVEWPMVLLHDIDFYVCSGESFLVNAIGLSLIGMLFGVLVLSLPKLKTTHYR